jgi:RND family efflux transporter MFP subunit
VSDSNAAFKGPDSKENGSEDLGGASIRRGARVPLIIAAGVAVLVAIVVWMYMRAVAETNKVALAESAKGVTVIEARAAQYQASRRYIGTIDPWIEAKLGPQFTSAYVDTVLVRPGAVVKRGQVLATLDCRNASAESKAIQMQARALEAQQEALAHQASRIGGLLDGGFVSTNEVENQTAASVSKQAELLATNAKLLRASLEVDDCVMKAPFDGEVAGRMIDPGAFARPGSSIVSIVDRRTLRIVADVPETDFDVVSPNTEVRIHVIATNLDVSGKIARRSPAADASTRTVHFEIDLPDPERHIPVGTTAELRIDVGQPIPATEIPLIAASVRGTTATLFTANGDAARKVTVQTLGEIGGSLFLDPSFKAGTRVVTEGRSTLKDGERIAAKPSRERGQER